MRVPGGLYNDSPAFPLLRALSSYWDITTADGATTGDNVVCAGLVNEPSYDGLTVKLLSGLAAGQVRLIAVHAAPSNTLITDKPFTNAAGGVITVVAGTLFAILSVVPGGGGTPPSAEAEGLYYSGTVGAAPGANQFTIAALAGLGAGKFDGAINPYWAFVLRDAGGGGLAPQGEMQVITAYATGTGIFTTAAFTAAVDVGDEILILHPTLANAIAILSKLNLVFGILNAMLTLKETGGTLTSTAVEQDVVRVEAPMGVFKPTKIKIDCTLMAWGDSIVLRWYERLASGGAYVQKDELQLDDVQVPPLRNIELEPNRHGTRITLQQIAGAFHAFPWEYIWED